MAASYAASKTLAMDQAFRDKLRMASIDVIGANLGTTDDGIKAWNRRALHDWAANEDVVSHAVANTPTITSSSTDAELKARLTTLWPTLANLTAAP